VHGVYAFVLRNPEEIMIEREGTCRPAMRVLHGVRSPSACCSGLLVVRAAVELVGEEFDRILS
jgi:hypothetical protein